MRKLLVAIDGSESATRALDYAASLARTGAVTLDLLYVYEDVSRGGRSHAFQTNEELERHGRMHGEALLAEAVTRTVAAGAQAVPVLAAGNVAEAVLNQAETLGCDSIVMGMKGHSLLAELALGSTTMTVLRVTRLPVTLVK